MTNRTLRIQKLTSAAMLIALGIIIPMFMPKVTLPPASFTLASHVPVFIAMFISPVVAVAVAAGTTLGFFFSGLPLVITARAATHLIFAVLGALWLKKRPQTLSKALPTISFSLIISIIHAACEVLVVVPFYFTGALTPGNYDSGFLYSVLLMVGVGGLVHSMVDFGISLLVFKILVQQKTLRKMFSAAG